MQKKIGACCWSGLSSVPRWVKRGGQAAQSLTLLSAPSPDRPRCQQSPIHCIHRGERQLSHYISAKANSQQGPETNQYTFPKLPEVQWVQHSGKAFCRETQHFPGSAADRQTATADPNPPAQCRCSHLEAHSTGGEGLIS